MTMKMQELETKTTTANLKSILNQIKVNSFVIQCFIGFLLRLTVILFVERFLEDSNSPFWPIQLKFTDVDYKIFLQAANYVSSGLSPFQRHTYRYTPLLSWMMKICCLWWKPLGKILFSLVDLLVAQILKSCFNCSAFSIAIWWLFNPFVIAISTRGSADSIVCALSLISVTLFDWNCFFVAGFVYGLAIHFKLYPIIFCIPLLKRLWKRWSNFGNFILGSIVSFVGLGVLFWRLYGWKFIFEAYLYHLIRKDHRHNFSPFFYSIYHNEMQQQSVFFGLIALIPSIGSWSIAGFLLHDLKLACFLQTCLFLAFNKVITSQYYLWIFCWFPLFVPVKMKTLIWFFSFLAIHASWNYYADLLENAGENYFFSLWLTSLGNFVFSIASICWFIQKMLPFIDSSRKIH